MRTRILSTSGPRDEIWPDDPTESIAFTVRQKLRYREILARVHTLELLGLSEALTEELALRNSALEGTKVTGGNSGTGTTVTRRTS